jgi:hypothetical protein
VLASAGLVDLRLTDILFVLLVAMLLARWAVRGQRRTAIVHLSMLAPLLAFLSYIGLTLVTVSIADPQYLADSSHLVGAACPDGVYRDPSPGGGDLHSRG